MYCLEINTSKKGRLWPTEYYKIVIDALTRGGAKHSPFDRYPDLSDALDGLVIEREGRYYPQEESPLFNLDDVALSALIIRRVNVGQESICVSAKTNPSTESWHQFCLDYFGTIGDGKAEKQSKRNREILEIETNSIIDPHQNGLSLSFQLNQSRNNRDLDNLVDSLIPFFNSKIPGMDSISVFKEPSRSTQREVLRVLQNCFSLD